MTKKTIVSVVIMVILSACVMMTVDIGNLPKASDISAVLLARSEYGDMQKSEIFYPYTRLYSLGVREAEIFRATDGTARELAVLELDEGASATSTVEILQERLTELEREFADNEEELMRINESRIIRYDRFVVLTVCDSFDTAEKVVHDYFETHKTADF